MKNIRNYMNNIVAVFVVFTVFLLIIPLPAAILDFLFIMQIGFALMILLVSMYVKESLEFSVFPSLLLVTTLLRLGLNISSTRSILTRSGYAGEVIKIFGQFVIRGNVAVGLIIFFIIVLVQYLVITKGAERVAEVSARFTLDALPGKQMAVDADLNSGLISEDEARERREKIQREAAFFGAMDGASKFVKGDAVMSVIVTLVNLAGGIGIGIAGGMKLSEAFQIYSSAAVGDGLMSQIPALLISVSTGMLVTRSASKSDINTDFSGQFLSQPEVFIIAGISLFFLIFTGFPPVKLLIISAALIFAGIILRRRSENEADRSQTENISDSDENVSEASYYRNIDDLYELLNVEQLSIDFGYSLVSLIDEKGSDSFLDRIGLFRKQYALDMGIVIPPVKLRDSGSISPNQYSICIKGEEVAGGEILTDHYLGLAPYEDEDVIDGIETVDPAFGTRAKWISEDKKLKAEILGYTLIDPVSVIITHLSEVVRSHAGEILSRNEISKMLENTRKTNPDLVNDTVPSAVSAGDLHKVLSRLVQENIPVRDFETILETLCDYGSRIHDTDVLTEYVRQALRRTVSHRFSEDGQLDVITLDHSAESLISGILNDKGSSAYTVPDSDSMQTLIDRTINEIEKVAGRVQTPVILTSPDVRLYFRKLADKFCPNVVVLSYSEVDSDTRVRSLGSISLT